MDVSLVTATGTPMKVNVKPTDTIEQLKLRIINLVDGTSHISSDHEPTVILGDELKNGKTVADYKIKKRSTLHLVYRVRCGIQIFISNNVTNRSFVLNINPASAISGLKAAIQERERIPIVQQHLMFAGQVLDDTETLTHYSIGNDSTVHLSQTIRIFVQDNASCSDMITIEAEPLDTIEQVKLRLESALSAYMSIDQIGLNFLKGKIHDPKDYYKDCTLNLMLYLFQEGMRIFVDETNIEDEKNEIKMFTFEVSLNDSIEGIYSKIKDMRGSGINPWNDDKGKRMYAGQWPCIGRLHGDGGILLSNIYKKSCFDLSLFARKGMLIFCEPKTSKRVCVEVDPQTSVAKMKASIQEKGLVISNRYLSFNNVDLEDDRILSYYGIPNGGTLSLKAKFGKGIMKVHCKSVSGQYTCLEVEPHYTIEEVKMQICNKFTIPPDYQRIMFEGHQLEDGQTLADYNIQNESTLLVLQRLRGC